MANYFGMSKPELEAERAALQQAYDTHKAGGLALNMARGLPCTEQLELSAAMLADTNVKAENGTDVRNYGMLEGLPEARRLFAELLGTAPEEVFVGGNASLALMYFMIDLACRKGMADSTEPWAKGVHKFLCPTPGYDRHFRITEDFGFDLITVPMGETGPDMEMVEQLVKDPTVKGIWCVPVYSNPDGYVYSDETVQRLASMETAAPDFKIFWDNAYVVHHLTEEVVEQKNLMDACKAAGNPDRALMFCSTSKISFAGAGVGAMGASVKNIAWMSKFIGNMTIGYDKINQLRHVHFFKNKAGILAQMEKHRAILAPKFSMVEGTFAKELSACGSIAHWTCPKGGYFISLYVQPGCAKRIAALCKDAGLTLTGAGAAYPYGKDPKDEHLRIAPTMPPMADLEAATALLCVCVRLATVEQLLAQ